MLLICGKPLKLLHLKSILLRYAKLGNISVLLSRMFLIRITKFSLKRMRTIRVFVPESDVRWELRVLHDKECRC